MGRPGCLKGWIRSRSVSSALRTAFLAFSVACVMLGWHVRRGVGSRGGVCSRQRDPLYRVPLDREWRRPSTQSAPRSAVSWLFWTQISAAAEAPPSHHISRSSTSSISTGPDPKYNPHLKRPQRDHPLRALQHPSKPAQPSLFKMPCFFRLLGTCVADGLCCCVLALIVDAWIGGPGHMMDAFPPVSMG